jgi:ATP-binding cassette, subfamily F, member 3
MAASGTEYYRGSYSTYLQEREIRWAHRFEVFEGEKEKLLKDVEYIKKNIAGQNTLQAKGKLKRLTRVVQAIEQVGMQAAVSTNWSQLDVQTTTSAFSVEEAEKRVRALRPPTRLTPDLHLHLHSSSRSGELVIRTRDIEVGYPGKLLFRAPDIELRRTDCAALIGPNGAGKSTFLKTILGQIQPLAGELLLGASLHVAYFAQAHEGLDPDKTLVEEINSVVPGWLPGQVRDYLGRYLFSGDDVFKRVSMLSGGERGRLALAKLALEDTNLLLLDEPTNHLDIPAQEVLQSVLDAYAGTILLVSHDRYLVDALATQVWEIDPDESRMTIFKGTYSELKADREKEAARLPAKTAEPTDSGRTQTGPRKIKKAAGRDERKKIAQLQELENTIAALEADLANLGAQLDSPMVNADEVIKIGREYERIQKEMDAKLGEWEQMQV